MGDDDGVGDELEKIATKLNEAKMMGRLSFDSSSSASGRLTSGSLDSLLTEDGESWSPRPIQKITKASSQKNFPPPLSRSKRGGAVSEIEMMKERFSRLLLGEDMSGSGQGVSSALAISNAITNLYASIFGQLWKLEPLPIEKKKMWTREMDWLISVSDHIVEMAPSYKTFPDGNTLEVMACKQRSDLSVNLPALRKLDSMLLELLDEFSYVEFWYVNQGKGNADSDGSALIKIASGRQKDKWWLPVPQVPKGGLSIGSKTHLHRKRECAVQILRASKLINTDTLSEMDVPESYLESLPKSGKACLGDHLFKCIASNRFSVENVLNCLDLSADLIVLERMNRLENAIYIWHQGNQSRLIIPGYNHSTFRLSTSEAEKMKLFSARAKDLLLTLKQQFPHLPQSTLEATKIQWNKDVGKSILESYSRVLETLAHNIVARIDDLLSVATKREKYLLHSNSMPHAHHTVSNFYPPSLTRNPSRNASDTASLPETPRYSYSKRDMVPLEDKPPRHSKISNQVLANYLSMDDRSRDSYSTQS